MNLWNTKDTHVGIGYTGDCLVGTTRYPHSGFPVAAGLGYRIAIFRRVFSAG